MDIKEAIKAVMLGHAVADAVGVPAEFRSRSSLDTAPITDMVGYGTYNIAPGSWSDDTSMSIAALDSLKLGKIDYLEIMDNFSRWCFNAEYTPSGDTFDIGNTCYHAISVYKSFKVSDPTLCGMRDESSNGNGSLMRIHPFCLYLYYKDMSTEEKLDVIYKASSMTHAHERSLIGCGIYSFVLWALLDCPKKESVYKALEEAKLYFKDSDELDSYRRLFDNFEALRVDEINSTGYVVDSLEAAIWCILTTKDYKECVLKAVNLGSDTDTVAAIAGGLAAALYGYSSIPAAWLDILIKREYIENMCDAAAQCWAK